MLVGLEDHKNEMGSHFEKVHKTVKYSGDVDPSSLHQAFKFRARITCTRKYTT